MDALEQRKIQTNGLVGRKCERFRSNPLLCAKYIRPYGFTNYYVNHLEVTMMKKRVLILAEDLYDDRELWYPYIRMKEEGLEGAMAIDRAAWIALRPRPDTIVRVSSLDFEQNRRALPLPVGKAGKHAVSPTG